MGLGANQKKYGRLKVERIIKAPESLEDAVKQFKKTLAPRQLPALIRAYWQPTLFGPDDAIVYAEVVNLNAVSIPETGEAGHEST